MSNVARIYIFQTLCIRFALITDLNKECQKFLNITISHTITHIYHIASSWRARNNVFSFGSTKDNENKMFITQKHFS